MGKFKKGDRVVVIDASSFGNPEKVLHASGTIHKIDDEFGYDYIVHLFGPNDDFFYEEELELEKLFNSPLYKALL